MRRVGRLQLDLDELGAAAQASIDRDNDKNWNRLLAASGPSIPEAIQALLYEVARLEAIIDSAAYGAYIRRLLDNASDDDHAFAIEHVGCWICGAKPGAECTYGKPYAEVTSPQQAPADQQHPGKAHTRRLLKAIHLLMDSPQAETRRLEEHRGAA